MKVMVVGSGGREHALLWKLRQAAGVTGLVAVPGNAGIAEIATCKEAPLTPEALLQVAQAEGVDFTVVGPEVPLVAGVVDAFLAAGRKIFGPEKAAAQLEGSKAFAKAFMARHGIPAAASETFSDLAAALAYLKAQPFPTVIKDSALAAGKGVTIAADERQAVAALEGIFNGAEGKEVVIEEFLQGQELSLLFLTDGEAFSFLPLAQDYKQALEGDEGPMTGGMGVVAPAPLLTDAERGTVTETIVLPTLAGLKREGLRYRGVIFIGLMKTAKGVKVLEYNVRFGDPETQAVLPLLQSDVLELLLATAEGRLAEVQPAWSDEASATVVMAAPGYPGDYQKGIAITIPEEVKAQALIFHAGTVHTGPVHEGACGAQGQLASSGGRVLNVGATAATLTEAIAAAYQAVDAVDFPGAHFRRDIGGRLAKGPSDHDS